LKQFLVVLFVMFSVAIPSSGASQTDSNIKHLYLDVRCFHDLSVYTNSLMFDFKEKPLFLGTGYLPLANFMSGSIDPIEGVIVTYVNQESGTFTNVIAFPDGSGCELGFGTSFTPYSN
jgi:hypothetical protein